MAEYNGETDLGSDYEIYNYSVNAKDSTTMLRHDGLLLNNSSDDETTMDGQPDWMAHAWGYDFLEVGMSLRALKMYWKNKTGVDYFQEGQTIGICGMNETPIDDWGTDMTTRGVISVVTSVPLAQNGTVPTEFTLSNNYPNPFNPSTNIDFAIPKISQVSLTFITL